MDTNDPVGFVIPQLARLEVSGGTASDPTTPSTIDSPQTLETDLREWLNAALSAAASNPKVYAKLLVSNAAAGSIIGKGGGNINDFQQKTYAKIQLSKASEYFPGTVERILMLTGRLKQVVAALGLIFSKLSKEGVAPLSPKSKAQAMAAAAAANGSGPPPVGAGSGGSSSEVPPGLHLLVKLLVPQSLCGIIIGRNGSTIRQFATDTQTSIKVTATEGPSPPMAHRIVTVTGQQEGVLKAIALLTLKMSEDHKFSLYNVLPVASSSGSMGGGMPPVAGGGAGPPGAGMPGPYGGAGPLPQMQPMPYLPMGPGQMGGMFPGPQGVAQGSGGYTSLTFSLTEEQGNYLLGPDGRGAADVSQASGVRVKVEKDVRPGGRGQYRRLVLSGSVDSVQFAQWLLSQKLAAAAVHGGYAGAAAAAAAAMGPPPAHYLPQQVSGTTYFQPMMPGPPPYTAAMPAYPAAPQMPGHLRMVAMAVPQPVPLRGGRSPA